MKQLHIAIASTTSKPGKVEENLKQIAEFARRAGDDGAQLLLTPEMSATGYGNYPVTLSRPATGRSTALSRKAHGNPAASSAPVLSSRTARATVSRTMRCILTGIL